MQISKLNLTSPSKFTFISFLLIFLFLFQACKKADIPNTFPEKSTIAVIQQPKDFFTISVNAPNALKVIVKEMQKQLKENDVKDFLNWHGQPIWSKIIKFEKDKWGSVSYAIPTLKNNEITGFFAATIDKSNNIQFEMHRKNAILLKKAEYTYADFNLGKSKNILNLFIDKTKYLEQTNSLFLHCWLEWVEQTTFQETSTSNMECQCGHWELICMETGGGGTGGGGTGGGGTGGGGGETGGGGGTGGGCGGGGGTETFTSKWWSNEASLLSPCELIEVINRLSALLGLNALQIHYLMERPARTEEIDRYLTNNPQNIQITKDHLDQLTQDIDYNNFVENHAQTGDPLKIWWEDEVWLRQIEYQMPEWAFNFYMLNTRPSNKKPEEFADKCEGLKQMALRTKSQIQE
jgi:uncharacterized membrane protein YgcG